MANESAQTTLHITQDERGRWSLTLEQPDGSLRLLGHSAPSRASLLDEVRELTENGYYRNAVVKSEEPRPLTTTPVAPPPGAPLPRRVGEAPMVARATAPAKPPASPNPLPPNVSKHVWWTSDGGGRVGDSEGDNDGDVRALFNWIHEQKQAGRADLVVYGGDVYNDGTPDEYDQPNGSNPAFYQQIGNGSPDVADDLLTIMCQTPGNHDWHQNSWEWVPDQPQLPPDPHGYPPYPGGYDGFWSQHPFKEGKSMQPIDPSRKGGGRYEHCIDLGGWRLIFLDTGALDTEGYSEQYNNQWNTFPWPMRDPSRAEQLEIMLDRSGSDETTRANIVFAHHSRLSCGWVGDNCGLDVMWRLLFDTAGKPRAVFTLAGHDHNVSVYKPLDHKLNPVADDEDGVGILVNGAGGAFFMNYNTGTLPTAFPENMTEPYGTYTCGFCVTQIELTGHQPEDSDNVVPLQATATIWSFGLDPEIQDGKTVCTDGMGNVVPGPTAVWSHTYSL